MSTPEYDEPEAPAADPGERVPPHDLLAEQSAIGGMLLSRDAAEDVLEAASGSDFYFPKHEIIRDAVAALIMRGEPTDVIAVTDELTKTGQLTRAGGAEYLHTLTGLVPTAANAGYYASIVAEKAVLRRLVEAGTRIVQMGYASEGTPSAIVANAQGEVDRVQVRQTRTLRSIGEGLDELVDELENPPTYLPSPWESLNGQIGGFGPGELFVIAARPGDGKSLVLNQIAMKAATRGVVAFSSLEMKFKELQKRMIARYGEVHMTAIRQHSMSDQDWHRFADAKNLTERAPVFVDDSGAGAAHAIADIRAHARAVQKRGGSTPLSMIVVDYLQLVSAPGSERHEQVSAVSRGFKMLAGEFGVPVVVAAQLNRGERGRGAARPVPTLSSLRESGAIEQDADGVLLLHRDPDKRPNDIDIIVAKARAGAAGKSLTMQWQPHYARVLDPDWRARLWGNDNDGGMQ